VLDTSMGQRAQTDRGLQVAQGSVFITLKSQCPTTRQSSFEMSARQIPVREHQKEAEVLGSFAS
jgi:hypothetical protein